MLFFKSIFASRISRILSLIKLQLSPTGFEPVSASLKGCRFSVKLWAPSTVDECSFLFTLCRISGDLMGGLKIFCVGKFYLYIPTLQHAGGEFYAFMGSVR